MNRYWLCGWRVISEPELPELRTREDHLSPDLSVRFGAVPEKLEGSVLRTPFCSVSEDGSVLITVSAVGRFLIRNGTEILIQPAKNTCLSAIRLFLWDMALAALSRQRGLFPLHGSCVEAGGEAVVLAGPPASGKSTLAFALAVRGHRVLADNVTVIDASVPAGPAVIPAPSFVSLWRDSLENAQAAGTAFPHAEAELMRPELGKYQIRTEGPPTESVLPLRAVLILERDTLARAPRLQRVHGLDAIRLITAQVSLTRATLARWFKDSLFQDSSRIADKAFIGRLRLRHDFADLEALAIFVEA